MDRTHVKNILAKRLNEYMQEAEQDLKVTELNLKEKCLLRSSLACKYLRYSYEETAYKKTLTNQIEVLRENIKKKLFQQKQQGIVNQSAALDKLISIDAEKELLADPTYKKLKEALNAQEDIIRLLNEIQKIIAAFGYDLANCKGILQLEQI
jgi:hypothetical protein